MSPRRTVVLAATFAILVAYFLVFEGITIEAPPPEWQRAEKILACPAGGLMELSVSGPRGTLSAERAAEGWMLSPEPAAGQAARAAVDSLAAALCELPVIDAIEEIASLRDFGLEPPPIEIRAVSGHWKAALFLGDYTPARNLLYARRDGHPGVLKVGALLRAEVDKALAHAGPAVD
ncbi:MAG: DUF4340 domain-containing protein, partial [Candidatus Binatia bacterium]